MNLGDVMDEIASQLGTIKGLRVSAHPVGTITPPAAIVAWPEDLDFDETYGRGTDRMTLPVVVLVAKPTDQTTKVAMGAYCSGSGARSIKAVLEVGTYAAFDSVRVTRVDFDVYTVAAVGYLAAIFNCDIIGNGAET
jgi:hypothetical protein